ncbi:MAG: ASCH domain-containing protein, partial [Lachnospirales bacterium]
MIEKYWSKFLEEKGLSKELRFLESFCFGDNDKEASERIAKAEVGSIEGACCTYIAYELESKPLPVVGEYSIVTNWIGEPRCIVQTTKIIVTSFKDVT